MRKTFLLMALALTLGAVGCGNNSNKPVVVTPKMEAEQKQAQENVQIAESARQQSQKPDRTQQQGVFDSESARQRN